MRRFFTSITFFCLLVLLSLASCSDYKKLGRYEKRWAFAHPFAALKIRKIKKQCDPVYRLAKTHPDLDAYENGGKQDAYRHMFYSAMFASKVKSNKVTALGIAHEKDNYRSWLKGGKEEKEPADSLSCEMDLLNNELGVRLTEYSVIKGDITRTSETCIALIKNGGAWYMSRNEKGEYLSCDGKVIDMNSYKGKWNVPKCLIQK